MLVINLYSCTICTAVLVVNNVKVVLFEDLLAHFVISNVTYLTHVS